MQGDNGYADAVPEHETAQSLACLTINTEVDGRCEAGMAPLKTTAATEARSFQARASKAGNDHTALDDPFWPPGSPITPMMR
jgi:hypothetical protein